VILLASVNYRDSVPKGPTRELSISRAERAEGKVLKGRDRGDAAGELEPLGPLTTTETAEYLSQILPELVRIADRGKLEMVAYFLDMARITATECVPRSKVAK